MQAVLEIVDTLLLESCDFGLDELADMVVLVLSFEDPPLRLKVARVSGPSSLNEHRKWYRTSAIWLSENPRRSVGIRPCALFFSWFCFVRNRSFSEFFHE